MRAVGNIHIFKKRRLLRFCFWLLETSQTSKSSPAKATVDVYGVCYIPLYAFYKQKVYIVIIHIGVGYLGVARSGWIGQCEGLWKRDELTGTDSPAFFFLYG